MESNRAERAGGTPDTTTGDSATEYLDKLLFKVMHAYHRERATSSSALFDSILRNGPYSVFFVLCLVLRYAAHISQYQVLWCVALTPLFLYFYMNYAPFLLLEEDIVWITRELRLLRAISKDAGKVKDVTDRADAIREEIWGCEPGVVSIKGLDEAEAALLDKAKDIVSEAEYLVETFKRQKTRRASRNQGVSFAVIIISENFKQIRELFTMTKRVKQEINDFISMKEKRGINICESLERSRFNITSLLDRSKYGLDRQKSLKSKGRVASAAALTSSVQENITSVTKQNQDLQHDSIGEKMRSLDLQLLLLHPFLKDSDQGIGFESEVEEAWLEELEEIVKEANEDINRFLQKQAACGIRWLSIISNWQARRKLKRDISRMDFRFTEILERKERYGFKFIRRDSSKLVCRTLKEDRSISSVVNQIRSYLDKESDVFGEVLYEVTALCNQVESMHRLVVDEGTIDGRYNSGIAWLKQTTQIVASAERNMQTFMDNPGTVPKNHLFKTRAGVKLCREIDQISQSLNLVRRCIKAYSTELWTPISVVGLEEDIQKVVSRLTTNEHGPVISIVGIGGVGRTTLAKEIYNHVDIEKSFPCRVWVNLAEKSKDDTFLDHVAKQICKSTGRTVDIQNAPWIHELRDIFKERKYLLVLDNMTVEERDSLKAILPAELPSESRILLTTCDKKLASQYDDPHWLRLRTKEESWKLFIQMVQFPPKEENNLAKEIVRKCGGLPRAIFRVGYLMSGKDVSSTEELKRVLRCIIQNDTPLVESYTKTSVTDLHPRLCKCLSYFKLFPKNFEIPARRLIALWIAEKEMITCEDVAKLENVAVTNLSQLIDQNMIQVVEKTRNGEVKSCCIPHAIQKRSLQQEVSSMRLVDHLNRRDPTFGHIHGESSIFPKDYKKLLSILSFDTREGNNPGEGIGKFLQRGVAGFHQLQVLDLERVFRPELPYSIGRLGKLRYLGLRWTYLESVPTSIGDLLNLQTLDVKHTYVQTLPTSIWKLQKLRHLYLNQSHQSKFMRQQASSSMKNLMRQQASSSMKNLKTLCGVFVDEDSNVKDGLAKLINLRKLDLAFQLGKEAQNALAKSIVKMKCLQSLKLKSVDEKSEPRPLELEALSLSGHENLSSLNLFGKIASPITVEFPVTLTDLTLSASFLSDDPMPKLEKLPKLKSLCFYSNSYIGIEFVCSATGFPELTVLKLWKLPQLKYWDVEEDAMKNLRELEIRSCTNLKVPTGLKHLKTLNQLKLTNMPEDFIASIAETKGQLWDDHIHSLAVVAVNWESDKLTGFH